MREEFASFYRPTDSEFKEIWESAVFVLDTNVLLNLYRYPEPARQEFSQLLSEVRERLWVPYHAALEFQRNRPAVIAEQRSKFRQVQEIVVQGRDRLDSDIKKLSLKERHSSISAEPFIAELHQVCQNFLDDISELENSHPDMLESDPILDHLEEILAGRIGPVPAPTDIEAIQKEAEVRYKKRIPPGYLDQNKKDVESSSFSWGGSTYEKQFGDYVIWSQILSFVSDTKPNAVIFVTDDTKEDWWLVVGGNKTVGPRPELVDEVTRVSKNTKFYMYRTYRFLSNAKARLASSVSDRTITEVRDVSSADEAARIRERSEVHSALGSLLPSYFPSGRISATIFPDFTVELDGADRIGVELVYLRDAKAFELFMKYKIEKLLENCDASSYVRIILAVVVPQLEDVDLIRQRIAKYELPDKFEIMSFALTRVDGRVTLGTFIK